MIRIPAKQGTHCLDGRIGGRTRISDISALGIRVPTKINAAGLGNKISMQNNTRPLLVKSSVRIDPNEIWARMQMLIYT